MLFIHLWNYWSEEDVVLENAMRRLYYDIGRACMSVAELELKDASGVLIFKHGSPVCAEPKATSAETDLIIMVELFNSSEYTTELKRRLAEAIGRAGLACAEPDERIRVIVRTFNSETEAVWISNE